MTDDRTLPMLGGKKKVPSDEEIKALSELKSIKQRVRDLKRQLEAENSSLEQDGNSAVRISELNAELSLLKKQWIRLEKERDEAAHRRMVALGHEEE